MRVILWTFCVLFLLSSCSANRHLGYAKWHIDRAKLKGYIERFDTLPRINNTGLISITRGINIKAEFISKVDTVLQRYCDELIKGNKPPIDDIIKESINHIKIDTLVKFEDGFSVRIVINDGDLQVEQIGYCLESQPAVVNPHWSKNLLLPWLIMLIVLVLGLFYFVRK